MIPDRFDRFPGRRPNLFGSPADRLLENTQSIRLDLMRYIDDEDRPAVSCAFKLVGCLDVGPDVATGELLLGIVRTMGAERREEGGAQ